MRPSGLMIRRGSFAETPASSLDLLHIEITLVTTDGCRASPRHHVTLADRAEAWPHFPLGSPGDAQWSYRLSARRACPASMDC